LRIEQAVVIRDVLWRDDTLMHQFIAENPARLDDADLEVVSSWSHRVVDQFFVTRYLKRHTVFIDRASRVFAVLGLHSPIADILGPGLPQVTDAVLVPFAGRIVIDGLLTRNPVSFGSRIREMLDETYRQARQRGALVKSLPY
jgi:hypothetical protein